ncbi:uncharacterized protein LOC120777371 isoform X1 [Bactrocera tryoni]|uniref:uncharacterized protein LOC120777371 isoform X1 n=1 Tax=Bactrocera tryoni TaxID=59916 RepID=UPI001A97DDB6|nr:uncharacterized protein LOC120777371 isoform X1 [Bactrocera tryoni]
MSTLRVRNDAPCVFTLVARVFCMLVAFGGSVNAKVYDRCELAQVLHNRHRLDLHEVATWTCIAQHSSDFNTEAYAGGLAGGSHGLFQISDVFWCSPPGKGFACNLPCERLRDADLTDDLRCLRIIYDEHQRLSGDGYNAWNAYQQFCRHGVESYVADCFPNQRIAPVAQQTFTHTAFASAPAPYYTSNDLAVHTNSINNGYSTHKRGKIYDRCELAQELYYKHKMPMEQIPTWVCIAQHESNFDTSAVGRLNADGSADHGLFQISDLYWCSHDRYSGGKACGLQCTKLLDNDISDDVRCIKRIHGEHTRISGDGFTAWSVYNRDCRNQQYSFISACFQEPPLQHAAKTHVQTAPSHTFPSFQAHPAFPQTSLQPQFQSNPFLQHIGVPQESKQTLQKHHQHKYTSPKIVTQTHNPQTHKGKVYKRCELAQELYFKHKFPMQDIATWVCIAQHESNYDTAAVGRLNGDGSADHGLFQISDLYWCAHDSFGGKACNIPCAKLLDSDITDDVRCIRIIHEEHTRISGDGFTAWTVYNHHCRDQQIEQVSACFDANEISKTQVIGGSSNNNYHNVIATTTTALALPAAKGKVYKECELAQELYYKHKMPMEQIPTWVCIAKHESSFNTAAVGRLNADGSEDHGLFQISDLYWCTHDEYGGKACNIPCHKLLDSDISDDVRCIKTIYAEHTRISGDGFTAWTVYNRNCRNQRLERVASCFPEEDLHKSQHTQPAVEINTVAHDETGVAVGKGKIYQKCELAQELYFKHKMPMKDVPTWVCIAQHESSFNTAAVGRLNADGSADHGLFQISDLYWCSHEDANGKACHISCNKLLDNDITDDVRCVKTIYEEHMRLSGDGFTAWTVYNRNCRNQQLERISACFDSKLLQQAQQANEIPQREPTTYLTQSSNINQITTLPNKIKHRDELNHPFVNNPFLNQFSAVKFVPTTMKPKTTAKPIAHYGVTNEIVAAKADFVNNPFLNQFIQTQQKPHSAAKVPQTVTNTNFIPAVPTTAPYAANPFLSKYQPTETKQQTLTPTIIQHPQKQSYHSNPFLSKYTGQSASFSLTETTNKKPFNAAIQSVQLTLPKPQTSQQQNFHSNPFLTQFIEQPSSLTAHKPVSAVNPPRSQIVAQYQNNPFLQQISAASQTSAIQASSQTQQQHVRPTPSSTEKTKLHVYPTKPYVNSEVFRTTPVKISASATDHKSSTETKVSATAKPITTTTRKPQTQTTKQYYTTLLTTTTTKRPTTVATVIRKPTTNNAGSATKRPSTTWNWQQVQSAKATSTTGQPVTQRPSTQRPTSRLTTTRQPIIQRPTTRQPTTRQTTTRPPTTRQPTTRQTTTQQPTTRQPATRLPTTKAKPQVSTTRAPQTTPRSTKLSNNQKTPINKGSTPKSSAWTTTIKPQTTKNPGLYQEKKTTWNAFATATTKRPTVTTKNVGIQKPLTTTTTRRPTTTQNAGLRKPTTAATTRKPTAKPSTTKTTSKNTNDKTANLRVTTTTTRRPGTSARTPVTQKTTATIKTTTTKRPTTTTQRATKRATPNSKTSSNYSTTKVQQQHYATTTTRKPTTTVRTPTTPTTFAATKPPANAHPTRRPPTASLNNFSTTKVPYTTKQITTATPFTQYTKPSTQKPKVTTTKPTALTKTTSTTRGTTRKPALYVASATNQKPNVTRNPVHTTPTKASLTVTTAKYRDDPFSHPFFDKYKEQFKVFTTTTTRKPTSAVKQHPVQAHFGEESEYYKQFRDHAAGSAKTVYAYAFGQNGTLAGHYGR